MAVEVRLRVAQLHKFMRVGGIETLTELGRRLDEAQGKKFPPDTPADLGHLSRITSGKAQPSARFIAALLRVFPDLEFSDLFEVIEKDGGGWALPDMVLAVLVTATVIGVLLLVAAQVVMAL